MNLKVFRDNYIEKTDQLHDCEVDECDNCEYCGDDIIKVTLQFTVCPYDKQLFLPTRVNQKYCPEHASRMYYRKEKWSKQ